MNKLFIIAFILIVVFIIIFITQKPPQPSERSSNIEKEKFLSEIVSTDQNYALYIKHKEFGEFMVVDQNALLENRDNFKISTSLANFLPWEADRTYGASLFKDNVLIKNKHAALFKSFEIWNLVNYSVPVSKTRESNTKAEIYEKLNLFKTQKNIFISLYPELPTDDKEFHFSVNFPSISVPITLKKDDTGYEQIDTVNGTAYNTWIKNDEYIFTQKIINDLEQCIREKSKEITNFYVSISSSNSREWYLVIKDSWKNLETKNGNLSRIDNYIHYTFRAYLGANKVNAERLMQIDFNKCLSDEDRRRNELAIEMKRLVQQSTTPKLSVDDGDVIIVDYKDIISTSSKLYEQEYTLEWLEVENY